MDTPYEFKRAGGGDYHLYFFAKLSPEDIESYLNRFEELRFVGYSEDEKKTIFYFTSPKWPKRKDN